MEYIALEEERIESRVSSSFFPQLWPGHMSQTPLLQENNDEVVRQLPSAQKYLPCHYFDYICGSSTGA